MNSIDKNHKTFLGRVNVRSSFLYNAYEKNKIAVKTVYPSEQALPAYLFLRNFHYTLVSEAALFG